LARLFGSQYIFGQTDGTFMHEYLPKHRFRSLTDITPEDLMKMGAKAVSIDLDNTSVRDGTESILPGVREWVDIVRAAGLPVVVISNALTRRTRRLSQKCGVQHWWGLARKPDEKYYKVAACELGIRVSELAHIGDQIFTDVLGANRAGAISVYVDPYGKDLVHWLVFKRRRLREAGVLEKYEHRKRRDDPRFHP
jgi:HAD superfamily phosphatase (TIGR01668 family)